MEPQWHASQEMLAAYSNGSNPPVVDDAIEAHIAACPACRARLAADACESGLEAVWERVQETVSVPSHGASAKVLMFLGVPEEDLVVVRASAGLHRPWTMAVLGAVVAAIAAASVSPRLQDYVFIVLAPLIPVLAVAVAYDLADPFRELSTSTPAGKLRIALLRAVAALLAALPLTVAVGLFVPGLSGLAFVWLLPAFMLSSLLLLLLTWLSAWKATFVVVFVWLGAAGIVGPSGPGFVAPAALAGQIICAVLTALFIAGLALRTTSTRFQGGYS